MSDICGDEETTERAYIQVREKEANLDGSHEDVHTIVNKELKELKIAYKASPGICGIAREKKQGG